MEAILQRDRILVGGCLATMVLLAWTYLLDMAADMSRMPMPPMVSEWDGRDIGLLFLMWCVMMVAMMVPSAAPMILAFLSLNKRRQGTAGPAVSTYLFLLGYVLVWSLYSAGATLAQWGLHEAVLISPAMVVTSPLLTGFLLVAAGIFQWTALKKRCLTHCRSPLAFLMSKWREGRWGALAMGFEHGGYCVGCCWILMALLFAVGVMNLFWVAAIAIFVMGEKLLPYGEQIGKIAGVGLVVIGLAVVAGSL